MLRRIITNTSCHCLKMRRSAANVVDFYDEMLKPSGVTVRQYSLLYEIAAHEGCNVRQLSEATELDRSTLARSLKPLLNQGLIVDAKAFGKRDSALVLTARGRRTMEDAAQLWQKAQTEFEKAFGEDQVRALESALKLTQYL